MRLAHTEAVAREPGNQASIRVEYRKYDTQDREEAESLLNQWILRIAVQGVVKNRRRTPAVGKAL